MTRWMLAMAIVLRNSNTYDGYFWPSSCPWLGKKSPRDGGIFQWTINWLGLNKHGCGQLTVGGDNRTGKN